MEEIEDPTERLKEATEAAEEKREKWTMSVALYTSIVAVLAAIAGMLGNHHSNEGVLEQIKSSDSWAHYQAKGIKWEMADQTRKILDALGKPQPQENADKLARYEKEKDEIKQEADAATSSSEAHMARHITFARSVTIFQIAIALSGVAILTRRKLVWYISMCLSTIGIVFFILGFI